MATASSKFRVRLPRISTAATAASSNIWKSPAAGSEEERPLRDLRELLSRLRARERREARQFPESRGLGERTRRLDIAYRRRTLPGGGGDDDVVKPLLRGCLLRNGGAVASKARRRRWREPRTASEAFKTQPESGLCIEPPQENGEMMAVAALIASPSYLVEKYLLLGKRALCQRGGVAAPDLFSNVTVCYHHHS